ncbi:hypothetical protein MJC1_00015 [Methylocystis sp. MJC1]|jgi:hypothetical protein|nr:hypothetical protein MJC1_00015 [Methylocystis sp. MJC1]
MLLDRDRLVIELPLFRRVAAFGDAAELNLGFLAGRFWCPYPMQAETWKLVVLDEIIPVATNRSVDDSLGQLDHKALSE